MAKSRTINSAIRMSQSFAKLTHRQRDLWHGIIVVADDQGRLPGLAAAIRSMVWPLDDISVEEVESDLIALETNSMVERYRLDDKSYMQVVNWWKYQKMQWAGESSYPPPEGWLDRCRYHGPGREIMYKNWKTPGGYCIVVNDDDKVNDNVNVKPLAQSTTTKVCDKGSQFPPPLLPGEEIPESKTPYTILLDAFEKESGTYSGGNLKQRDNEALVRLVKSECEPEDVIGAIKYNRSKGFPVVGVASVENGAIIERDKRLGRTATVNRSDTPTARTQ